MIAVLKDQDEEVLRLAAQALGWIGPEAKEAVPALIAALTDQEAEVRRSAAYALGEVGVLAVPRYR
jgi:HEAT repeat protein